MRPPAARTAATGGLAFPALPHFGQDVPAIIEPATNRRTSARLAQFLIEAGAINRQTLRAFGGLGFHDACHYALNHWLARTIGNVQCFTPQFELVLTDLATGALELSWKEASVCHWVVGAGLDYLENCVPTLGSTVLDLIEHKGSHAYPLFTPGMALDEASYLYWRGEDDETLALDEDCGDDPEARAAMANDMVTRATIEAAFPPWALDYHRPRLHREALVRIATDHTCAYVRRAAALASALDATRTTAQFCPEYDGAFIGFGAVLCWREGDLAVQISDDYANLAWQGEYCDEIGTARFSLDDPKQLRAWMRKVRPNLEAIGRLDALLRHLTERE